MINLERSKERWKHLSKILDDLGLQYERVTAVDASDDSFREKYGTDLKDYFGDDFSLGELANLLGHQKVWRLLAERGCAPALILEDDAFFRERLLQYTGCGAWIPGDAEIIQLEGWSQVMSFYRKPLIKRDGYRMYKLKNLIYNSAAYLVTQKGVEALLETRMRHLVATDQFLFTDTTDFRRLVTYVVDPAPCIQLGELEDLTNSTMKSLLSESRDEDRKSRRSNQLDLPFPLMIVRKVAFLIRVLKRRIGYLLDRGTTYRLVKFID